MWNSLSLYSFRFFSFMGGDGGGIDIVLDAKYWGSKWGIHGAVMKHALTYDTYPFK